jgi:hypothetical protein
MSVRQKRFAKQRQKQTEEVFASRYSERKGWLLKALQGVWFLSGAVRPAWMRW